MIVRPLPDGSRWCSDSPTKVLLVGLSGEQIFHSPPGRIRQCSDSSNRVVSVGFRGELSLQLYLAAIRFNEVVGGGVIAPVQCQRAQWETKPLPLLGSMRLNKWCESSLVSTLLSNYSGVNKASAKLNFQTQPVTMGLNDVVVSQSRQHFCPLTDGVKGA